MKKNAEKILSLILRQMLFRIKEGKVGFLNIIKMGIAWMLMVASLSEKT